MKYDHLVKFNGEYYTAGTEVPAGAPVGVEMTDEVPDGALVSNADGSVNAYDGAGNVVGTVSAEEVEQFQEQAGETLDEQEKPKRGRKPKEA